MSLVLRCRFLWFNHGMLLCHALKSSLESVFCVLDNKLLEVSSCSIYKVSYDIWFTKST